jgi:uncharacterized damage-inducible protein DinB
MTVQEDLKQLFDRDLKQALAELKAYQKEENLWKLSGEISNTAGNLLLHICGNLRHFIGSTLGNSGYIRRREEEFNLKDVRRKDLEAELKSTKMVVSEVLGELTDDQLQESYPINVFGKEMTTQFFLIHLHGHLTYHLGQVNYHRRLIDKK